MSRLMELHLLPPLNSNLHVRKMPFKPSLVALALMPNACRNALR